MENLSESLLRRYDPINEVSIANRYSHIMDILKKRIDVYIEPSLRKDHVRFHSTKSGTKIVHDIAVTSAGYHYRGKSYDHKSIVTLLSKI